jgi:hypothetical protein
MICRSADNSTNSTQDITLDPLSVASELRMDIKGIQQVWVALDAFQLGTRDVEATAVRT